MYTDYFILHHDFQYLILTANGGNGLNGQNAALLVAMD